MTSTPLTPVKAGLLAALLALLGTFGPCATSMADTPPATKPAAIEGEVLRRHPATSHSASNSASAAVRPLTPSLGRTALSLGVVLGLILLLWWGARRAFPHAAAKRSGRGVQVLGRTVISPKQQVLVIQVGKRLVVVGDCGQQMSTLCQITDPDEMAAVITQIHGERGEAKPFDALFGRASSAFAPAEDRSTAADASLEGGDIEPGLATTRDELRGLIDRVKTIATQFNRR